MFAAVLAGRVRALPENDVGKNSISAIHFSYSFQGRPLEEIDVSHYPRSCQYTYELASGELEEGENGTIVDGYEATKLNSSILKSIFRR